LRTWIATLPINERDDLLVNILAGSMQGDQTAALQQLSRFTKTWRTLRREKKAKVKTRTVGELLKKADLVRQNRERLEAEKKAAELAEKQRLQKIAREKRSNEILGQEPISVPSMEDSEVGSTGLFGVVDTYFFSHHISLNTTRPFLLRYE
jgi:hypothetical protein